MTILNNTLTQPSLTGYTGGSSIVTVAPGGNINLTNTANTENLAYKIVEDAGSERKIVGYGTGDAMSITIDGVDNVIGGGNLSPTGGYILYVWVQKNNDYNFHEGSTPLYFGLAVEAPPTVQDVSSYHGETDVPVSGSIAVQFSKTMDTTKGSITLSGGGHTLNAGAWSQTTVPNDTYTIGYSGLDWDTDYTVTIQDLEDTLTMRTDPNHVTTPFRTMTQPEGSSVLPTELDITTGETGTFTVSLGKSGNLADQAELTIDNTAIAVATATPTRITQNPETVTGELKGDAVITVKFSGGDLATPTQIPVTVRVRDTYADTVLDDGGAVIDELESNPATFPMPGNAVTVKAVFAQNGDPGDNGGDGGSTGASSTGRGARSGGSSGGSSYTPVGLLSLRWDGVETEAYSKYAGSVIIRFDEDLSQPNPPAPTPSGWSF